VSVDVPALLTHEELETESAFQLVPDLGAEIARLRKQLQRTRLLGIVGVSLLATLLAVESRSRTSADAKAMSNFVTTNLHETIVFGKVVTKELMLTSGDGRTRARLGCSPSGQPMLTFTGVEGSQIRLGFSELPAEVAFLNLSEPERGSRVRLFSNRDTAAGLHIGDETSGSIILHQSGPLTSVSLQGPQRKGAAVMNVDRGNPSVRLRNPEHRHVLDVPPLER
jgi:hypothetical protein